MENFGKSAGGTPYEGARPWKAAELGNTEPGDGVKFHGRGFVQLTGRKNYKDWQDRLDVNLVTSPKKAKDLKVATAIIVEGMRLGTFTTRKLSDYLNEDEEDWRNARRIVNGTNKADLIAGHSKAFYAAISYTTV